MKPLGWPNVVLGVWLIIAPWVLGYVNPTAEVQDVVIGMLITVISLWTRSTTMTSAGALGAQIALAVWLFIGPWVLGYTNASPAFTNDLIVSTLIITFAIASTAGRRVAAHRQTMCAHGRDMLRSLGRSAMQLLAAAPNDVSCRANGRSSIPNLLILA